MERGRSSSRSSETTSAAAAVVGGEEEEGGGGREKVYVAVGKQVKGSKSTLLWALQNAAAGGWGKKKKKQKKIKIIILHVHRPVESITVLGARFRISILREREAEYHRTKAKREMEKVVDEYLSICNDAGVEAEKACIETASVEKGIVELINELGIRRLVMGAASDGKYSRKMTQPKSTKAVYVNQHAPPSCRIWFVCKGRLIYTRESNNVRTDSISRDGSFIDVFTGSGGGGSSSSRSLLSGSSSFSAPPRSPSAVSEDRHSIISSSSTTTTATANFDEIDGSAMSVPVSCGSSRCSVGSEASGVCDSRLRVVEDNTCQEEIGGAVANDDDGIDKLSEQATLTAESSNRQAVQEESLRRQDAEKEATEATRKAKVMESMYLDELKRREEAERRLARSEDEVRRLRREREEMVERIRILTDENAAVKRRLERSDAFLKVVKERIVSATDSLRRT